MTLFDNPASSLASGNTVVSTAGTQVQLTSTSTSCVWVIVTAAPANTGKITVGDSNVDATADAERGITLSAGDSCTVPIRDVSKVWIDATVSGDEVGYLYGIP